jgi:hypothetical protein
VPTSGTTADKIGEAIALALIKSPEGVQKEVLNGSKTSWDQTKVEITITHQGSSNRQLDTPAGSSSGGFPPGSPSPTPTTTGTPTGSPTGTPTGTSTAGSDASSTATSSAPPTSTEGASTGSTTSDGSGANGGGDKPSPIASVETKPGEVPAEKVDPSGDGTPTPPSGTGETRRDLGSDEAQVQPIAKRSGGLSGALWATWNRRNSIIE